MQIDNLKDPEDETITSKPAVHPVTPISYMAMNHHPDLLAASLIASLEWLACDFQIKNQIPFDFRANAYDCATGSLLNIGLFHIAQEACHNISQHAHASSVAMYLHTANDILQLEIIDNGCGMDIHQHHSMTTTGLQRMQDQAIAMGGELTIASAKGKGTIIRISVPFMRQANGSGNVSCS